MGSTRILYTPRPDATPEGEVAALASVYRFIIDCREKENAAGFAQNPGGDDGTTIKGDSADGNYT